MNENTGIVIRPGNPRSTVLLRRLTESSSILYRALPVFEMSEPEGHVTTFALRPACSDDEAFLYELFCSTRTEEMASWGLDASQQDMFLRLQFSAQRQHYELAYEGAEHSIILVDARPAGRILVFRSERELLLVDIALLPDQRCNGIGTALILDLLGEADRTGKVVGLHVAKENRARRLYQRLGFETIGDTGVYFRMERRPDGSRKGDLENA